MLEILAFSATHMARLLRQRAISSVELVEAHLAAQSPGQPPNSGALCRNFGDCTGFAHGIPHPTRARPALLSS